MAPEPNGTHRSFRRAEEKCESLLTKMVIDFEDTVGKDSMEDIRDILMSGQKQAVLENSLLPVEKSLSLMG